jgi:hypothetical protein
MRVLRERVLMRLRGMGTSPKRSSAHKSAWRRREHAGGASGLVRSGTVRSVSVIQALVLEGKTMFETSSCSGAVLTR